METPIMTRSRRSPLIDLELDAERKAQEYKRRLIEEGMKRLAAEERARAFFPQDEDLPPDSVSADDPDVDSG